MKWRRAKSPFAGLEFELDVPEGLDVHRDVSGFDVVVAGGYLQDPRASLITVRRGRDDGPVTLEEYVARVKAAVEGLHLVDEGPAELAGLPAWWTVESALTQHRALVVDTWMLVRDGAGWTVTVQMPWLDVHKLRDGAHAVAGTLRFR